MSLRLLLPTGITAETWRKSCFSDPDADSQESRVPGLWLNLGHGALGFTLAMGSAGLLADRLAGRKPAIDGDDFSAASA